MQRESCKILLLSGGADSMLLLQDYNFDKIVFFDYGQNHKEKEYSISFKYVDEVIKLPLITKKHKEFSCRNLLFITSIVAKYGDKDLEIYIGKNKDDKYADNSDDFYRDLNLFINKISLNNVRIKTPLQAVPKKEILKRLKLNYYTD